MEFFKVRSYRFDVCKMVLESGRVLNNVLGLRSFR